MEFILVGQPNSGKSTIFNNVVGYRSVTANFPGITVGNTIGYLSHSGKKIKVVDVPGTYSLQTSDDVELVSVKTLLDASDRAVIINVVDASVLSRSLELTLQLMELQKPMVLVLNMIDEAEKKGISIDMEKLSTILGMPVVSTVGRKGSGVFELFKTAVQTGLKRRIPNSLPGPKGIEKLLESLTAFLKEKAIPHRWNDRFLAIKLLEKDPMIRDYLAGHLNEADWSAVDSWVKEAEKIPQKSSEFVMGSVRHSLAFDIFEKVSTISRASRRTIQQRLDDVLMHPLLGYLFIVLILYAIFTAVFSLGDWMAPAVTSFFETLAGTLSRKIGEGTVLAGLVEGSLAGFGSGIGIAVPYLFPFFLALSFLEDSGYLARITYLFDNVMHRFGLHGLSIIPLVMGYGCTVPGIMATRMLKSKRDKLITATLTTLVPCSARLIIILGVAGAISKGAALMVYVINLLVLGVTAKIMSAVLPEESPGLILAIPDYRLPGVKALLNKTWFRLKEFILIAIPLLVAGSIVLELTGTFGLSDTINSSLSPFTSGILGLPAVVGIILLMGVLRKELALVLLITYFGTSDLLTVMTPTQLLSFTIFATFYMPCLATFAVLGRELRWRNAVLITAISFLIAVLLTVVNRLLFPLFT